MLKLALLVCFFSQEQFGKQGHSADVGMYTFYSGNHWYSKCNERLESKEATIHRTPNQFLEPYKKQLLFCTERHSFGMGLKGTVASDFFLA